MKTLKLDATSWTRSPPSLRAVVRAYLFHPGFRYLCKVRIIASIYSLGGLFRPLGFVFWAGLSNKYGAEIAMDAVIGARLYVPHPYGIVIGRCEIGQGVMIHQNVTIGVTARGDGSRPVVGDNCTIGAGAVILGNVTIGHGATIGANAVIIRDVPSHSTAVGVPARVISRSPSVETTVQP